MLDFQVIKTTITSENDIDAMVNLFNQHSPEYGAFDTETTGLHIISDVPFLFQFGWLTQDLSTIYTFVIDLENHPILGDRVLNLWNNLATQLKVYAGHNVKYDMHMLTNINHTYLESNLMDTMACIRLAHDNIPQRFGGPSLSLKNYANRYIDKSAKLHDKKLQRERSAIAKELNKKLQDRFKATGTETIPEHHNSWTVKAIQEITKDILFEPTDLPHPKLTQSYQSWLQEDLPQPVAQIVQGRVSRSDIPYNILNRQDVVEYGHYDIVWTLAILDKTLPVIYKRENEFALEKECKLLEVFYTMERVGFDVDYNYLMESKHQLRNYIRQQRKELLLLTGQEFTVAQHTVIKDILNNHYDLAVDSTAAGVLDKLLKELPEDSEPHRFISLIEELRTLEKWYSTYLIRLEHELIKSDRLYTQINSVGAASGRVSSDFQQFPKGSITDEHGNELFNPRRIISVPDQHHPIIYLDYSQIELRIQAIYTLLLENPDLNLCRAYMPFQCIQPDGTRFDPFNQEHINRWQEDWYKIENGELWEPIDLHGATTEEAFDVTPEDDNFRKLRALGKRINFAKNYGAQLEVTRDIVTTIMPDVSEEELKSIDGAYYRAFPGIKTYQSYCYRLADHQAFATNLFGVRYWNVNGHKLINMLIQGAGAWLLKLAMIKIHELLKDYHTQMQMNIHDEISFIYDPRDPIELFQKIKDIMEEWDDAPIPIIADAEITYTYWSEKEDWEI